MYTESGAVAAKKPKKAKPYREVLFCWMGGGLHLVLMRVWGVLLTEEEQAFLEDVRATAGRGRTLTAFAIQAALEEKIGRPVSEDYLYDLLHRHGWCKVMPRPYHPKADREQQEGFKKNFRNWWQPPRKNTARRTRDR
jgi:hypothetical protein